MPELVYLAPRNVACPACYAAPDQPCTVPTETSRRDVTWFHLYRESLAQDLSGRTLGDVLTELDRGLRGRF